MSNKNTVNYVPVYKKCSDQTSVWRHFLKAETGDTAKCKICDKVIKCVGGTTTGLRSHLRSLHAITLDSEKFTPEPEEGRREIAGPSKRKNDGPSLLSSLASIDAPVPVSVKKSKMSDYFTESNRSLDIMISRMTALDGMPFRAFTESEDLRHIFNKAGYKLPSSANSIKDITVKFYDKIKSKVIKEIQELKNEGHKFCLSLDEWTSSRNRRYVNVNIHCAFFQCKDTAKNLGLCRTYGSVNADKCEEYLRKRLNEFGINFDTDIICITSVGASVMTKLGRNLNCIHQLCLAHGLQLAIVDTFYAKSLEVTHYNEAQDEEENDNDDALVINDDAGGLEIEEAFSYVETNIQFKPIIEKVRAVVRMFRKSPTKSDVLQKYIKMELGKENALLLDCKTRWSTLCDMIGRFIKVKAAILKAVIDVQCAIQISEQEWSVLRDIYENLEIIKVTVEALCREDATLVSADVATNFALKKLEVRNTQLSRDLHTNLTNRLKQRRLPIASLMQYLHDPNRYFNDDEYNTDVYPRLTNDRLQDMILNLLSKYGSAAVTALDVIEDDYSQAHSSDQVTEVTDSNAQLTNKDLLDQYINKINYDSRGPGISASTEDTLTLLKVEMLLFENGGDRGQLLTKLYRWLRSIKPTSVESERVFSAAGVLCNKLRTSLNDKTIDCLSFLRTYFQQQKKKISLKCDYFKCDLF